MQRSYLRCVNRAFVVLESAAKAALVGARRAAKAALVGEIQ